MKWWNDPLVHQPHFAIAPHAAIGGAYRLV